jgi:hypothetical protein
MARKSGAKKKFAIPPVDKSVGKPSGKEKDKAGDKKLPPWLKGKGAK